MVGMKYKICEYPIKQTLWDYDQFNTYEAFMAPFKQPITALYTNAYAMVNRNTIPIISEQ